MVNRPSTHENHDSPTAAGVPIVRVNNFAGNSLDLTSVLCVEPSIEAQYRRSRPRRGDVLITLVGSIGQVAIAPPEIEGWNLARAVGLIPTADEHHSKWIALSLRAPASQAFMHRNANTTVQTTFNLKDLAQLPIPYPAREVREAILSVLSPLDDKIDLNRRINETLEAMAQAIFRDWFVDFGPVRRKMAGATDPVAIMGRLTPDPNRAVELAGLFPDALSDDYMPVGWSDAPLSAHLEIIGGGTPKTNVPEFWGGDIPWFSVVDTPPGSDVFVFDTEKTITPEGVTRSSARLIAAGTTIISARGTVGNLAMAAREMTFNQSCYALQSSRGDHACFVYLLAAHAVEQLRAMAHGSVFSTITRQTFDAMSFPTAPLPVLSCVESVLRPLFDRIKAAVDENRTLAETRDYLLPRLMSGEVRVQDVGLEIAA